MRAGVVTFGANEEIAIARMLPARRRESHADVGGNDAITTTADK